MDTGGTCPEVALNGPWPPALQPGMPITTDEVIAEPMPAADRFAAVERLAPAGPLERALIDPASATFAGFGDAASDRPGLLYSSPKRMSATARRAPGPAGCARASRSAGPVSPGTARRWRIEAAGGVSATAPQVRAMLSAGD